MTNLNDAILILGAGGFVGRQLALSLAAQGRRIICVSRRPLDLRLPNIECITGEPNEAEHFAPLLRHCSVVVHAASSSTPGSSAGKVVDELQQNLRPTLALLQALQSFPHVKLLFLSSGGSLYRATPFELSDETSTPDPRSYHGAGKIASEYFIGAWSSQFGGSSVILRPSNIYGPGQVAHDGFGIVPTALDRIRYGQPITIWGDGSAIRDYLYIDDFITLCIDAINELTPIGVRIVNAASGHGASLNQLFGIMEHVTGKKLHRVYETRRAVDASRVVMNPALAGRLYGWKANITLDDGIARTWSWLAKCTP